MGPGGGEAVSHHLRNGAHVGDGVPLAGAEDVAEGGERRLEIDPEDERRFAVRCFPW